MFQKKKIEFDTVGEVFKSERERQKYSRSFIARKINVNETYIEALEESYYNKLPADVYARNFVRQYIKFLELDERLLYRFEKELDLIKNKNNQTSIFKVRKGSFLSLPYFLRIASGIFIIFLFLGYIAYSIYNVLSAPWLELQYPNTDILLHRQFIEILGMTIPNARVEVNGEEILVGKDGYFDDLVPLQPGFNLLTIVAQKKYSRKNTILKRIIVLPI